MTIPSTNDAKIAGEAVADLIIAVRRNPRVAEARTAIHTALTERPAAVIFHTTLTLCLLKILCDMMLSPDQTGASEPAYPWFAVRAA